MWLTAKIIMAKVRELKLDKSLAEAIGPTFARDYPVMVTAFPYKDFQTLAVEGDPVEFFGVFIDFTRTCNAGDKFAVKTTDGFVRNSLFSFPVSSKQTADSLGDDLQSTFDAIIGKIPEFLAQDSLGD